MQTGISVIYHFQSHLHHLRTHCSPDCAATFWGQLWRACDERKTERRGHKDRRSGLGWRSSRRRWVEEEEAKNSGRQVSFTMSMNYTGKNTSLFLQAFFMHSCGKFDLCSCGNKWRQRFQYLRLEIDHCPSHFVWVILEPYRTLSVLRKKKN